MMRGCSRNLNMPPSEEVKKMTKEEKYDKLVSTLVTMRDYALMDFKRTKYPKIPIEIKDIMGVLEFKNDIKEYEMANVYLCTLRFIVNYIIPSIENEEA